MLKIYIIDDHKLVADGLKEMIDHHPGFSVIGAGENAETAQTDLKKLRPDVVLMDFNLPDISGPVLCEMLLKDFPEMKILGISMNGYAACIKQMLKAGAKGYVLKSISKEALFEAIQKVSANETYLDEEANRILIESMQNATRDPLPGDLPPLSNREKEVLKLLMAEYTTQEIAQRLSISHHTVEAHRKNMLVKLGARNTVGLVCLALNYNLLD